LLSPLLLFHRNSAPPLSIELIWCRCWVRILVEYWLWFIRQKNELALAVEVRICKNLVRVQFKFEFRISTGSSWVWSVEVWGQRQRQIQISNFGGLSLSIVCGGIEEDCWLEFKFEFQISTRSRWVYSLWTFEDTGDAISTFDGLLLSV